MLSNRHVLKNASICKNHKIIIFFLQRIYIDSEPYHEVRIKHDWIDPEEISIKGFVNIRKKNAIKNERHRNKEYNKYIWMGPHEGGDVFGLRRIFNMEEDIAFAPENWN
ncbi:hypothetical protein PUN28_015781 [Cardiocondyla obscurior]|uniref:Ycf15 n=1 Tax=Cardiocondyla obscurior TaxID=286306 RepID=A0AAW2EUL9_9HYME